MDTEYSLKRPPQKHHRYVQRLPNRKRQWDNKVSLRDIENLFDHLDSSEEEELPPLSPVLSISSNTENRPAQKEPVVLPQQEAGPTAKHPSSRKAVKSEPNHPAVRSQGLVLEMEMDSPFKRHKPTLTSSPIEGRAIFGEPDHEGDRVASPDIFLIDEAVPNGPLSETPPKAERRKEALSAFTDAIPEGSPELKICLTKLVTRRKEEAPRHVADGVKTPTRCSTPTRDTRAKTPTRCSTPTLDTRAKTPTRCSTPTLDTRAKTPTRRSTPTLDTRGEPPARCSTPTLDSRGEPPARCSTPTLNTRAKTPTRCSTPTLDTRELPARCSSPTLDTRAKTPTRCSTPTLDTRELPARCSTPTLDTRAKTPTRCSTPTLDTRGEPPARCRTPTKETRGKTPVRDRADSPVSAAMPEPQCPHPEKEVGSEHAQPPVDNATHMRTEPASFQQKLRESMLSRLEPPRNAPSSLKLVQPEVEDEFLILEDEAPLHFSLIRQSTPSQGRKSLKSQSKSSDEERPSGKSLKDSRPQEGEKQPELAETGTTSAGEAPSVRQESREKKTPPGDSPHGPAFRAPKKKAKTKLALDPGPRQQQKKLKADKRPSKRQTGSEAPYNKTSEAGQEPQKTTSTPRKANDTETGRSGEKAPETGGSVVTKREKNTKNPSKPQRKPRKEGKGKVRALSTSKERSPAEAVEGPGAELSDEGQRDAVDHLASPVEGATQEASPDEEIPKPKGRRNAPSDSHAGGRGVQTAAPVGPAETRREKRKRSKPGDWWRSCSTETDGDKADDERDSGDGKREATAVKVAADATEGAPKQIAVRKAKRAGEGAKGRQKSAQVDAGGLDCAEERAPDRLPMEAADPTEGAPKQIAVRKAKRAGESAKGRQKSAKVGAGGLDAEERAPDQLPMEVEDLGPVQLSPLPSTHREHSFKSDFPGEKVFNRVYGQQLKIKPHGASSKRPSNVVNTPAAEKRARRVPSNWWKIDEAPQEAQNTSPLPPEPSPANCPGAGQQQKRPQAKPQRRTSSSGPKNSVTPKADATSSRGFLKRKRLSTPKTVKKSLATFRAIYSSGGATLDSGGNTVGCSDLFREKQPAQSSTSGRALTADRGQKFITDIISPPKDHSSLVIEDRRGSSSCSPEDLQEGTRPPNCNSQDFRSGLSAMIDLQHYEEDGDQSLPSSRACQSVLSVDELCGPPLVPLELLEEDKTHVARWIQSVWPGVVNNGGQITVDEFSWYRYHGRALGFLMDMQSDSFCNGKVLLGSFAKKPLWVDHSATSVFHVLTSAVNVTVDGLETVHNPAQSFVAPCGNAYSIQNLTSEPALLCFTRMLAESPDSEAK